MSGDRALLSETAPEVQADDPAARRLSFGDLDTSTSFLMRLALLDCYAAIYGSGVELPMSLPELTVIFAIEANPDARQGEIADALKVKWPHMTKLVRGLELRGLVERYVPDSDRRSIFLRLTPAGIALRDEVAPRMRAVDDAAMTRLDAVERAALAGLLRKVAGWPERGAP